jgi:hypothetical protein
MVLAEMTQYLESSTEKVGEHSVYAVFDTSLRPYVRDMDSHAAVWNNREKYCPRPPLPIYILRAVLRSMVCVRKCAVPMVLWRSNYLLP